MKTMEEYLKEGKTYRDYWTDKTKKHLVGKKIVAVEYISESEVEEFMWHSAPIAIQLNDGHWIYPSKDDEGNDGGAMFTTYTKLPCIPVI